MTLGSNYSYKQINVCKRAKGRLSHNKSGSMSENPWEVVAKGSGWGTETEGKDLRY